MIPGFHGFDLIVILIIALLIFGPKKLPEMGSAIGKSIKEFRKGMNELAAHKEEEEQKLPVSSKDMSKLGVGSVPYQDEVPTKPAYSEVTRTEATQTDYSNLPHTDHSHLQ
jgi:sec-independent protein translocase protein TatA